MEVVKYIVMAIYAVICVALIVLITKQSKEDGGASGTNFGASAKKYYEKNKGKSTQEQRKRATIA